MYTHTSAGNIHAYYYAVHDLHNSVQWSKEGPQSPLALMWQDSAEVVLTVAHIASGLYVF